MSPPRYDFLIKLVLTGDSGVGKSSLLHRFCDDAWTSSITATIGVDFKVRIIEVDGKRIKLQIWDTSGRERFRTLTAAYYRGAMGILLVYDVTDEQSFSNIRMWHADIEQHAPEGVNKYLIGNKSDWTDKRVVTVDRGRELANELGIKFMETSAKVNDGIEEAFTTFARSVTTKYGFTPMDADEQGYPTTILNGSVKGSQDPRRPDTQEFLIKLVLIGDSVVSTPPFLRRCMDTLVHCHYRYGLQGSHY
ncbi:ras-domain-containing protein [Imleria badia]|nr:ras-domain-containing protein [Imleria badia]